MRRTLLLADDSVTIQRVIELTFADEDIEVVAVGDGDAAIARLNSDPPDIVLADTGMPGRDGYEVAAHVQRTPALSGIPVVLLTGALQPVDEVRAREAGCAGVLVKPFEPHMVISKVRELLERRGAGPQDSTSVHKAVPDSTAGTPADAILNAPPSEHATASSPDDYFARLDAAFATLNAQPGAASPARGPDAAPRAETRAPAPAPASSRPEAAPAAPAKAHTLADAFTALLAIEQGQAASGVGAEWSAALSDLIDEISRRVAEQVTDRVIRELAPDVVSRVAERVVREEMARLRQEAESSS